MLSVIWLESCLFQGQNHHRFSPFDENPIDKLMRP